MTKNKIIVGLSIALFAFVGFSGNIAMAQTVTGSGTLNYLPLWTSTSSIGDSVMYQSNGNIGIGTTAPNDQLEITGNFRLPITTSTAGVIKLGVVRFLHAYGNSNTFLGSTAGNLTMSSMGDNVGIGTNVLTANTTGYWNTSVGSRSLQANTTGYENTAIGERSLFYDTVGYQNTAAGSKTLYLNISGAGNSAFGYAALKNNSTGGGNSAFGSNALYSNSAGQRNIAVGMQAGLAAIGSDNIFLGYAAGDNVYSGDNNIIIGSNIDAPNNGGNQMYLGGVIYGDLLNKKIGIGTTTPAVKVDIWGTSPIIRAASLTTSQYAEFQADNHTNGMQIGVENTAGSRMGGTLANNVYVGSYGNYGMTFHTNNLNRMTIDNTGSVGIGTTDFTNMANPLRLTATSTGITGLTVENLNTAGAAGILFNINDMNRGQIDVDNNKLLTLKTLNAAGSAWNTGIVLDTNGNVGIGTTGPSQKLEVNGGMRLNTATAKPACDSSVRGTFWATQGTAGVKDNVEVCAKDASDSYAWRTLY